MKYTQILPYLQKLKVFSNQELRTIDPNFDKRKIYRWIKKGYIKRLKKGYYIFDNQNINTNFLYQTANKLYTPSYISLKTALSYYQLIPEYTFGITNVSTKRTNKFQTSIGDFYYQTLKKELFFGYKIQEINNYKFRIGQPEKVILDYLYLHHDLKTKDDLKTLRINNDRFEELIDKSKLEKYLKIFDQKALSDRTDLLLKVIEQG